MQAKIIIVGEAWGAEEERERAPFVGPSGWLLTQMLSEAGIHRADCYLTNVFNFRPPNNQIEAILGSKDEAIKGYPALAKGKFVPQKYISELNRLGDEILEVNPNIIIALGNTPTWALTAKTGISKIRGTTTTTTHIVSGCKILPTYHPSYLLRGSWDQRPIVVCDLMKAAREAEFPEIRRPKREIWIEPTIKDIEEFHEVHIRPANILSVDIETAGNQVTCIGFAPSSTVAIVIPFHDSRRKGKSYWPDGRHEATAWNIVSGILANKNPPKLFQNGLYDIAFLWRAYGIKVYGAEHDTMLLHHALQPETLKGLGFLGSIYTDEGAWKDMRKVATIKRDD